MDFLQLQRGPLSLKFSFIFGQILSDHQFQLAFFFCPILLYIVFDLAQIDPALHLCQQRQDCPLETSPQLFSEMLMGQFVADSAVVDETDGLVEHQIALQKVLRTAFHKDTLVLLHFAKIDVAQPRPPLLYPKRKTHRLFLLTNFPVLLLSFWLEVPLLFSGFFDVSERGVHFGRPLEDGHARPSRAIDSLDLHHASDVEIPLEICTLFDLLKADPFFHVDFEAPLDQLPQLYAHLGVELLVSDALPDGRTQFFVGFACQKWLLAMHQLIQHHSEGPNIGLRAVVIA